jgi:hypothetical protein
MDHLVHKITFQLVNVFDGVTNTDNPRSDAYRNNGPINQISNEMIKIIKGDTFPRWSHNIKRTIKGRLSRLWKTH